MTETKHPVPTGAGKRWWNSLSKQERELHTDWRFDEGHRNVTIQEDLKLSVGTIAGMKRRWTLRRQAQRREEPSAKIPRRETPEEELLTQRTQDTVLPDKKAIAGCEWPLAEGGSLRQPRLCGKPVVGTLRCCAEHAPLVYPKNKIQNAT